MTRLTLGIPLRVAVSLCTWKKPCKATCMRICLPLACRHAADHTRLLFREDEAGQSGSPLCSKFCVLCGLFQNRKFCWVKNRAITKIPHVSHGSPDFQRLGVLSRLWGQTPCLSICSTFGHHQEAGSCCLGTANNLHAPGLTCRSTPSEK